VVEKRYHTQPNTLKRCGLMTAATPPAWSVFKQIFTEHWDGFKRVYPRYDRRYYDGLVHKMLGCGDPDQMGYIAYRCLQCGEGTHRVAMSCKSSLCLRCAKVYVDHWVSQVSQMLHEGVIYRHIVLTVPEILRKTFYQQAQAVLSPFMRCGVRCLDDVYSRVSGRTLKGGYILVIQTHGRNGQYNPHLHIIATSGGWDRQAKQWVHLEYMPYRLLRKKWQWYLLTMLRQTVKTQEIKRLVDACYTRYREGFVTNVQKGDVPARYQSLARYLAKYVVSPPISLRRIDRYEGHRVTYHYRSHKTERVERETVDVYTFIGRMVQHVFPKGFQRVRYYGVQATKTFAKIQRLIQEALAKVQGIVKGAIKIIAPLTYRQRYQQSTGRDPLRCPHCHSEMGVWRIWHPTYGVIHDELEAIRRGKYASQVPRAAPAGSPGRTVWPAAGGIPLSLPGVP
jgi:putative transposase/transposase-like zinc-binding protein